MLPVLKALMNRQSRNLWRLVALGAVLLATAVSGADDDDDIPTGDIPAADVKPNRTFVIEQSTIDQWIFQENRIKGVAQAGGKAAAGRARIDSQLKALLDELLQVCQLSEAQRHKLTLAARGDVKRFFDQVEKVRKTSRALNDDQNQLLQIRQECSSLQQQLSRGLFGDESLFGKAIRRTLNEEQQGQYQAALLYRRRAGYRAAIEAVLSRPGNGVAFRSEQRESLQKLLLEETRPPLVFGQYDQQVVLLRLSQLPPEKLKQVLDKGQWKQLQPQLLQASGTEDYLAQYGVIEEPKLNSPVVLRSVRTVVEAPAAAP